MSVFVTDTHPLVWYATNHHRKLSRKVKAAFDQAMTGEAAIWVPTVVLWELSLLIKAGKIQLFETLDDLVAARFHARAMHCMDLTPEDVLVGHQLSFSNDPFDTMIVAMAQRANHPLITRDATILEQRPCEVYWD